MNLSVISTGSSNSLMNSDCVLVKRKPGPLNANTIYNYLNQYDPSEIKEGKLNSVEDNVYIYDLNDAKVMQYDLLVYVMNTVNLDEVQESNNFEAIGFIELTLMGLALPQTHEKIKIVYNFITEGNIEPVLTLDYSESYMHNENYISTSSNNDYRSYSRARVDSMNMKSNLVNSIESFYISDSLAPTYQGYTYQGNYYELEALNLDLLYSNNLITNLRTQTWDGDYWLEITYSNKETLLHNISKVPATDIPIAYLAFDENVDTTIRIPWHFAEEVIVNPKSTLYRLGDNQWYIVDSNLSMEDKLKEGYRTKILGTLTPGRNTSLQNPHFVYSRSGNDEKDWCLTKEIRDALDMLNTVPTPTSPGTNVWENSILKSYKLLETDMDVFVINEYNSLVNRNVVYFSDKTKVIINSPFKLIGNGELMVKAGTNFIVYLGSSQKYKYIFNVYDLVKIYFSSSNKIINNDTPVTFENTFIHKGKFYTVSNTYKLN